jgi:hypothetical protein
LTQKKICLKGVIIEIGPAWIPAGRETFLTLTDIVEVHMKRILLVIIFALFLVSCTTTTQQGRTNWSEYSKGNSP